MIVVYYCELLQIIALHWNKSNGQYNKYYSRMLSLYLTSR